MRISKYVPAKSGYDPCTSALTPFFYAGDSPQKEHVDYDIYYEDGAFIICRHFVNPPPNIAKFGVVVSGANGTGYVQGDAAKILMSDLAKKYPRRRATAELHGWVWSDETTSWITEPKLNEDGTAPEVPAEAKPDHAHARAVQQAQAERDARKFGNLPQKRNVMA